MTGMTEQEDFIINEPYQPTDDEKAVIAELEKKGLVPEDWDSGKKHVKSFKENLREDVYEKQNELCAYCRIHVPLACVPMHREHIVYKDDHPQWMFLPENLCIACPTCNEFKGTIEVLNNPQTKIYPKNSEGFRIIHPLYDRYSDHIELLNGILYRGKTPKGIFTINTCHLFRVELAEERVDQLVSEYKSRNIIFEIVHLLAASKHYVDDNDEFKSYIKGIVRDYKTRQRDGDKTD